MALRFRNLTVDPDDPVGEWPSEAILTALERGDLGDWQRIAAEIARRPWGRTSRQVEEALRVVRPYGIAEIMEEYVRLSRDRSEQAERDEVAAQVRALIAKSGLTRAEFASRVGTSTSRLSTYATGKVAPSATLVVRMRHVAVDARSDA